MMNERVATLTEAQAAAALAQKKSTVILLHPRPDGDAVGSAFALRLLLEQMGMRAHCLCADDIPHRLRFLCEGIQDSMLPASLPADLAVERVVSVDVASPAQLGALEQEWLPRVDVMIDHHGTGTPFAPAWVMPTAAAAGEMIARLSRLWLESGTLAAIPTRAYELMFAAIASDTGGFRYSNVTPDTHRWAAMLIESGIDTAAINHALFESKPYELMLSEQLGFSAMQRYDEGRVTVVSLDFETKQRYGLQNEHMETLVDVARAVEGTEVAIAIRQPDDAPRFRVSVRSNGAFSAAALCAAFGGGGHEKAAGCTVEAPDVASVTERLLAHIRRQMTDKR